MIIVVNALFMQRMEFQVLQIFDNGLRRAVVFIGAFPAVGLLSKGIDVLFGNNSIGDFLNLIVTLSAFLYLIYFFYHAMYAHSIVIIEPDIIAIRIAKPGFLLPMKTHIFSMQQLQYFQYHSGKQPWIKLQFMEGEKFIFLDRWEMYSLFEYLEQIVPDKRRSAWPF